jgi:hypothetical protein
MISRRRTLAAIAACSALPAGMGARPGAGFWSLAALTGVLPSQSSARAVGRAYLAAHPEDADPARLLHLLEEVPPVGRALARRHADPRAIASAVGEAVRDDFVARRTVKLEGWVLSQTEARLCALCSLA